MLWLRGTTDLRFACLRSVSVVGSRAASAYGSHVATELSAELAGLGWSVISGGAFGIDRCAHRGALAASGSTVAVLASGLNFGYPKVPETQRRLRRSEHLEVSCIGSLASSGFPPCC
jgi:DNA processing protein